MARYSSLKDKSYFPKPKIMFRILEFFVKLFYKKPKVLYEEELNHDRPIVYICNQKKKLMKLLLYTMLFLKILKTHSMQHY